MNSTDFQNTLNLLLVGKLFSKEGAVITFLDGSWARYPIASPTILSQ